MLGGVFCAMRSRKSGDEGVSGTGAGFWFGLHLLVFRSLISAPAQTRTARERGWSSATWPWAQSMLQGMQNSSDSVCQHALHPKEPCRSDQGCNTKERMNRLATTCLRTELGLTARGPGSCAVVGSSGSLLHGRWGAEIDEHELVMRFNNAPVAGYETIVGTRRSVRMMNSNAIAEVLEECDQTQSCKANYSCCPLDNVLLLKSGYPQLVGCLQSVCGRGTPVANDLMQAHGSFLAFERRRIRVWNRNKTMSNLKIPSGVYALVLSLMLCAERSTVDVYGFSLNGNGRYHYYDQCDHVSTDALDQVARHTRQALKDYPVRIHESDGAASEWVPAVNVKPPPCRDKTFAKRFVLTRYSVQPHLRCAHGLRSPRIGQELSLCCNLRCKHCGGSNCSGHSGGIGRSKCCIDYHKGRLSKGIRLEDRICSHPNQTGCLFQD